VPVKAPVCGLPLALSETVHEADREPVAPGVNATEKVQVLDGVIVAAFIQVLEEMEKSEALVPVTESVELKTRFDPPVLVNVTLCEEDVVLTT
jgi:hypothetical protein